MSWPTMTEKQKRFCDEYLIDLNATQAALRAGYSPKSAHRIGNENVQKPAISAYIKQRMAEKEAELIATQDEVLRYLTSVLRGEQAEDVLRLDGDGVQVVDSLKVAEKDRLRAAELLGKRFGLFTEQVKLDADMDLNIKIDYGDDDEH